MTRVLSYVLFVAFFFTLTSFIPFEGYIANSIAACASIVLLYCIHRKVTLVEGALLLLIITAALPAAILLLIGGGNVGQTIDILAQYINLLSSLQFLLPTILGVSTLIAINAVTKVVTRNRRH